MPRLTHTKLLEAAINGERLTKPNWNSLLDEMLRPAVERVGGSEKMHRICPVNMVKGSKEDEGYGYLPEIDISVQGQDANGACRAVVTAAQALGMSLDIGFMWRLKESAAHPGERGRIRISSSYARFWVTRLDQAARFSVSFAATPSVNVTPRVTKGNWFAPFRRRQVFAAA